MPGAPAIGVARKPAPKTDNTAAKGQGLPGLEDPYELTIEESPSPK